ncbi:MAG: sugar phosphate isomerase/epimerase family protein [bacterium]
MRLGVSIWSLHRLYFSGEMDTVKFIEYAGTLEIDGVELLDSFWKNREEEFSKVKEALAKYNLEVGAYAISNDFVSDDRTQREKELEKIYNGVDMALKLNTNIVRVFSGNLREPYPYEQAKEWIIEGLSEGAKYAEKHNVILALENHGLLAGRSSQVKEIIETVGSKSLRATIDIGNFLLVNQSPVEAVRELAPLASHIHLKDFKIVGEEYQGQAYKGIGGVRLVGAIVGEGEVDLTEVLKILHNTGYKGYLSLEFEGSEDPKYGTEESIKNTKKILKGFR